MAFHSHGATSATTSVASSAQKLLLSLSLPENQADQSAACRRRSRASTQHDGRDDEALLDDDLDVHQPVADDGRGERQRDAAEQHGRVLARTAAHDRREAAPRRAATNGTAPTDDPQTIHRSWRRAVTDRSRVSARIISASPPSRQTAR